MSSSEARRIHIEAWQTSGMSEAAYCWAHGLNTKTFGNWVRKHHASCRSGHSVACVGSGHDQANAYVGEYDASSLSGRSCVGTAVDGIAALVGGVVEVSLIANPGKIWLMVEPVDMRRGIDGLSVLVEQALRRSPCAGSAFVFCNRAGTNRHFVKSGDCQIGSELLQLKKCKKLSNQVMPLLIVKSSNFQIGSELLQFILTKKYPTTIRRYLHKTQDTFCH